MLRAIYRFLISRRVNGEWFIGEMDDPSAPYQMDGAMLIKAFSADWLREFREARESGRTVKASAMRADEFAGG